MSFIYPKYIFTCNDVIQNKNGSVTYHEVFENISVPRFPDTLNLNLVIGIDYSIPQKGNRKIVVKITDPESNSISGKDLLIDLLPTIKNQSRFAVNIIDVSDFKVEKEGFYSFLVYNNGELITRHDLLIERTVINDTTVNDESAINFI